MIIQLEYLLRENSEVKFKDFSNKERVPLNNKRKYQEHIPAEKLKTIQNERDIVKTRLETEGCEPDEIDEVITNTDITKKQKV